MTKTTSPLRDPELVEMLADSPELLAIADALVETREDAPGTLSILRNRQWKLPSIAAAAAVSAAVASILLISPWGGSTGLVGRALAAVGQGPVLHLVTEQPLVGWYKPISLASGKPIPVIERQEIWFDKSRDLKKTVTTLNGVTYDQLLETAQGAFTQAGFVYTCDWIAAHPVEAAQARVGCGDPTQTAPAQTQAQRAHAQTSSTPTLDLALAGFLDHYRSSLASGRATKVGSGKLDGNQVIWLRIDATGERAGNYPTEDVAIDASSYAPVLVRTVGAEPVRFRVTQIDTQPYDGSVFTTPARTYPPTSGSSHAITRITASRASDLLEGHALWLGKRWHGYRLVGVEQQQLTTGYAPMSHKPDKHSLGVIFNYASTDRPANNADLLQIRESTQCEMGWAMPCGAIRPTEGTLLLGLPLSSGITMRDGLYIALGQFSRDPVGVANALHPFNAR